MLRSPQASLDKIMKKATIPDGEAHVNVNLHMKGRYQLTVRRHGEIVQQTPWFDNLILNQGLDILGLGGNNGSPERRPLQYCQVGTGTSTPNVSQLQLDSLLAGVGYTSSSFSSVSSGAPNYIRTHTIFYSFAQGAVVGNVSEVGVGLTPTAGNLFSRARVVDGGGNPTTIAITAIDQLTVTYALSIVPDVTQTNASVVISGVTYPYTATICDANNWGTLGSGSGPGNFYVTPEYPFMGVVRVDNATNGAVYPAGSTLSPTILTDFSPSGVERGFNCVAAQQNYTYVSGSFTATFNIYIKASEGNASGGFQTMFIYVNMGSASNSKMVFYFTGAAIPKTNTTALNLVMTVSWSAN